MYTIKKQSAFKDTLKIEDQDGKALELAIDFHADQKTLMRYRGLEVQYRDMQKAATEAPTAENVEALGKCVVDIFSLLFGEENTKKILEFYANDYTQMLTDCMPYIRDVMIPALTKYAKSVKQSYKRRF